MKTKLFFALILFSCLVSFTTKYENNITRVTYKIDVEIDSLLANTPLSKEGKKAFNSLEYELIYDNSKSVYKPIDKIESIEENDAVKFAKYISGKFCFKDLVTKEKIQANEISDENFNVIKDFDEYAWEITTETKIINGYKCYKATTKKEEKDLLRGRVNQFNPVVWFAPVIPAPFGPNGLDGLPGLVLEGTFNGRIYFYATNIEFNSNSKVVLEKPKKGKYLTEEEFNELAYKKLEEIRN